MSVQGKSCTVATCCGVPHRTCPKSLLKCGRGKSCRSSADLLWELACLRRRCISQYIYRLIHRHRRQASSHRGECSFAPRLCCCSAVALLLILILGAPLNHDGRRQVLRSGHPGMDAGVAATRPWMADRGGPTEQCLTAGMPSLGEAPSGGARALCLLWRSSKESRRKGGTNSRRYRSSGYVHKPRKEWCRDSRRDGGISG